jgi:hypothetical protein
MKKNFTLHFSFVLFFLLFFSLPGNTQCPAGYVAAELNWDNLDFLPSNNARYTAYYPSAAFPYNQNFAIGTRRLNFVMAPQTNITLNGENGINTAHAGSFATAGDDVQFTTTVTTNTTLTMTFDLNVANARFSLFDLDNNQRATITAMNAAMVSQTITVVRASGTSGIIIAGSGTTTATATGPAAAYADNDSKGTINISINGPVNRVIITFNNAAGDTWLSDIAACVTGSFPNSYHQISRPFTGQPQYVLTVVNNNIYYVDPTNGKGYFLFNEPAHNRLNSMAYDPYERIVYYTFSLTASPTPDKTLKKYDVDTKTISVVIPNVNTFGIPTYESGVESGAASFYNGSLYLGIEGYTGTSGGGSYAAGRKSTIWKIDFDAAGNAVPPASQVFGVTADDGVAAQNIHDWSDFGISNGVLTDFDGSQSGLIDFYQFNMMTGARINYAPVGVIPRQVSIGWDEKLYNVDVDISLYNGTNGVGTLNDIYSPLGPTIPVGSTAVASWGDAAGPYRPFLDFGDAPVTYDPDPWSPACHDTLTPTVAGRRTKLRLGPNEDIEWLKKGFTTVEDLYEDGLTFVPLFTPSSGYLAQVSVFNNTGSNATVCAWLDYNGNGFFDPAEGIVPVNVISSAAAQLVWLSWPSTPSTLPSGSSTYLRIRVTTAAYGMTKNNSTGYYDTGEVEDYRVVIAGIPLGVTMSSFDAEAVNNSKVKLTWAATEDINFRSYDVERSHDRARATWEKIAVVPGYGSGEIHEYELMDNNPYKGNSYYRLKLNNTSGAGSYTNIRAIKITAPATAITLFPNPASDRTALVIEGNVSGTIADVRIMDAGGNKLSDQKIVLTSVSNTIELPVPVSWPPGIYIVQVIVGESIVNKKLVVRR